MTLISPHPPGEAARNEISHRAEALAYGSCAARRALLRCAILDMARAGSPGSSAGQMAVARSSKAMRSRWQAVDVHGDVVVAAAQVRHERVAGREDPR